MHGDWSETAIRLSALGMQQPPQFDVVLTSEVIYNPQNYDKIAQLLVQILREDGGVCVMANKLFYYGVGGSLPEFVEFLEQKYANTLRVQSLRVVNNKRAVKREILAVTRV